MAAGRNGRFGEWRGIGLCALFLCLVSFARPAAALGESASLTATESYLLAVRYENGEGVARDYAHAVQLYCDAANQNNAQAYFNLGWMYLNGRGVPRDDAIAVGWWQKAAAAGIRQAANLLARLSHTPPAAKLGCEPPPAPVHATWLTPPPHIVKLVDRIAASKGLDPRLVLAVIAAESAFDSRAVSRRNAMGLMQLMPETADRYGVRDPFEPEQNIRGGTTYLRWLLERFAGNLTLTLAAYNAGEGAVDHYGGVPPFAETIAYVDRIKQLYAAALTKSHPTAPRR
jgi:hypothetical protein